MQPKNQIFALIAAVLFAIALVMTVTVVSLSTTRATARNAVPQGTESIPVLAAPKQTEPPEQTGEPETETSETPPENCLLYQSNGDGTCSVAGIGGFRDACVIIPEVSPGGERVVRVNPRAFLGCEQITAVQIPASVREIGALAFANCRNLVYLSVSAGNACYCDVEGVLFTADMKILIQYPPMRAGNPAVIPASVTVIPEMAFYGCTNLKSVRYEGTGEDWDRIAIAPRNHSLVAASVEFVPAGEN